MRQDRSSDGFLKTLFIIIGVIASICAIAAVAYSLFRKYFQVTFDCEEGERGDGEDDYFADDEDEPFEPICCCEEEDEAPEEEDTVPAEGLN